MEVNLQKVLVQKGDTTSYNNTKDLNNFFKKIKNFKNMQKVNKMSNLLRNLPIILSKKIKN